MSTSRKGRDVALLKCNSLKKKSIEAFNCSSGLVVLSALSGTRGTDDLIFDIDSGQKHCSLDDGLSHGSVIDPTTHRSYHFPANSAASDTNKTIGWQSLQILPSFLTGG
jgi:hypothetical protein